MAFEADLPRIEETTCNRTTGAGCTNPPPGASFYPIFTTADSDLFERCMWQLGGAHIPGTSNTFGGSSTSEYGPLLASLYQAFGDVAPVFRFNNFRRIVNKNPCPAGNDGQEY